MSKEDQGWVSIHRSIQSHWLWEDKPFSRGQAWIDLILLANHQDRTVFFDGKPEKVPAGSFLTSISKLMDRWGWGKNKTLGFLKLLESEGMIRRVSNSRRTTITLVNYWDYQHTPDHWRTGCKNRPPSKTDRSRTSENPITAGFAAPEQKQTGPLTDRWRTADGTQTININNDNNCTVTVSAPEKEKIPLTTPPEQREIFKYIQKLKPGRNGGDELQYILNQGATDRLVRWAVYKAEEKGKSWSYARGILMNCLNNGQLDIPQPKPAKPSAVGWGGNGWEPSYDIEDLERRGLMVPTFEEESKT